MHYWLAGRNDDVIILFSLKNASFKEMHYLCMIKREGSEGYDQLLEM